MHLFPAKKLTFQLPDKICICTFLCTSVFPLQTESPPWVDLSTVLWINTCCSQTLAETIETLDEERNSTGSGLQKFYSTHRPMGPVRPPLHPFLPSAKSEVLRREQQKRTQSFKMEELPGPLITDQQNFSLEIKQEPEYVSTTTNIFLSSEHTEGMFFSSSSVFWCFSLPAGDEMFWVAVLTVGRHHEQ